jgi:uncharacterized RDD family membrane protein YckC
MQRVRYAGFWIRFVAHVVDTIILNVAGTILEYILLGTAALLMHHEYGAWNGSFGFSAVFVQVFEVGLYVCIAFPYYVWLHFRDGATWGKRLVGVRVVRTDLGPISIQQSILRCVGYVLSYLPFCAGFLMAAFHPEKRALHDLIAGTVSIRVEKSAPQAPDAPAEAPIETTAREIP